MTPNLYLFTTAYPYGHGETFIENEIDLLAEAFDNITIIPLYSHNYSNESRRSTPENCKVLKQIIKTWWQQFGLGWFGLRTLRLFSQEFVRGKVFKYRKRLHLFFIQLCTTNNLLHSKEFRNLLQELYPKDIMYFYWGRGSSNLLPFISEISSKKLVRFHGSDLYSVSTGGYIPLQEAILKETDLAVFISKNGQKYLEEKYPNLSFKSVVSYLGTSDLGGSKRSNDLVLRILSCSNVIPQKRVFLLYEALQTITNYEIEWTHIGGGVDLARLKEVVTQSRSNVKTNIVGRIPYKEVLRYYQNHMIDVFINVSSAEGLPVSLMEAISFDIPIIATNVGGTSEIVTPETGILLSSDPAVSEIADAIDKIQQIDLQPRFFWQENFNAVTNYKRFIKEALLS